MKIFSIAAALALAATAAHADIPATPQTEPALEVAELSLTPDEVTPTKVASRSVEDVAETSRDVMRLGALLLLILSGEVR